MMKNTKGGLRRFWRSQADLLENALSLGGTTVVTAVLGGAYWWVAARLLPPVSVGYGSAAIAAATLIATVGMAGYGSLLLGHVANSLNAGRLVATGLAVASGVSLALAIAYGVLAATRPDFAPYCASAVGFLLFSATACLTSATTVLDDAMVGLFLGPVQLKRNVVFASTKLVVLGALAATAPDRSGTDVLASWTVGIVLSVLVVAWILIRLGKRVRHSPHLLAFRQSVRPAVMHHWITLATVLPRLALPLIVTGILSATANGWLYPAWIIATVAYVVPAHLATSLFAVGAADRSRLGPKTRTSVRISLAVGVPASIILAIAAHPLLGFFGNQYAEHATVPMRWLMIAYIPNVAREHYVTVRRVEGRLATAAAVMTALAVLELGAMVAGASLGGLNGLAVTLAAAMWIEGGLTTVPLLRMRHADRVAAVTMVS